MVARDYYEEAHLIVDRLKSEGYGGAAAALEDVLEAGFSSTEILMGLRHHSVASLNTCIGLSDNTTSQLRELIDGISEVLDGPVTP